MLLTGMKKWQVKGNDDKSKVSARKKIVIERSRKETGLIVDRPKQISGTSNDGNTARKFFKNSSVSAAITGLDEDHIRRFTSYLRLSCGHEINVQEFQKYAHETAKKFVLLHGWYYMQVCTNFSCMVQM